MHEMSPHISRGVQMEQTRDVSESQLQAGNHAPSSGIQQEGQYPSGDGMVAKDLNLDLLFLMTNIILLVLREQRGEERQLPVTRV